MRLDSESSSLQVRTYREGVAAKAGHDLILEVVHWEATVDFEAGQIELSADPRSLVVRKGLRGVKPLTDKDRDEIRRNVDDKVLQGRAIRFRSTAVRRADGRLSVEGDLTIGSRTHPIAAQLDADAHGNVSGTIPLRQSTWGITPYRGLMGALRVRDEVEVVIEARVPD